MPTPLMTLVSKTIVVDSEISEVGARVNVDPVLVIDEPDTGDRHRCAVANNG